MTTNMWAVANKDNFSNEILLSGVQPVTSVGMAKEDMSSA